MSWTSITSNTSWQDLAVAQELATAFNRRAFVCSASTIETLLSVSSIDSSVQVRSFVRALQEGIESLAASFANPSATLTGQSSILAAYGSLSAAMTAAGLTASGYWRRIAEGGSAPSDWSDYSAAGWSYGKISDKDLAGPWLFKDLQLALSALKRMVFSLSVSSAYSRYDTESKNDTDPSGWNSSCDTLSGNVDWSGTGDYGTALILASKTLTDYGTYFRSESAASITSRAYVASLPWTTTQAGGATRHFIVLYDNGTNADPFNAITGLSSGDLGSTLDLGDNGGGSIGTQPAIPLPIYYGSATPTWQSIISRAAQPPTTISVSTTSAHLTLSDIKLILDFSWTN